MTINTLKILKFTNTFFSYHHFLKKIYQFVLINLSMCIISYHIKKKTQSQPIYTCNVWLTSYIKNYQTLILSVLSSYHVIHFPFICN